MAPPIQAQKYSTAYVTGSPTAPTGADVVGNIMVVVSSAFTSWSSYSFVGGLSASYDTSGYVIICDSTTAGVNGRTTGNNSYNPINAPASPNPVQIPDKPTYWVSLTKDGDGFLALVNKLPPSLDGNGFNTPNTTPAGGRPYFDGTAGFDAAAAKTWLNNNGYWTSYP
jgi:hypothetical protein